MDNLRVYGSTPVPPIIAFGAIEKEETKKSVNVENYDYVSQTTPFPMFCGTRQSASWCAKLKERHWFHDNVYIEVCDDAKDDE